MNKSVAIIIVLYKQYLDESEKISLNYCLRILHKYPIICIAPESLDLECYNIDANSIKVERFNDTYFESIDSYNRLMLSKKFYQKFLEYEYILLYQLDAIVFSDRLEEFLSMQYDYIGAPWINGMNYYKHNSKWAIRLNKVIPVFNKPIPLFVGNGGFSLRKTKSFINLLKANKDLLQKWKRNEDIFFSLYGKKYPYLFKVAPVNIALSFAFEMDPQKCFFKNNREKPFGCHAWEKYDKNFIEGFL